MKMKNIGKKVTCYISIISLLICGLPFINSDFRSFKNINEADFVFAGEILDKAEYNPIDKNLSFEMKLDVSQRISVEAKVNDNPLDKMLVTDYEVEGANGELIPREPCKSEYYNPRSVNPGKLDNVRIEQVTGTNELGQEEKRIRFSWDGRIDGIPAIDEDLGIDAFAMDIFVYPQGYPERNKDCVDTVDANGNPVHIPGENWTWSQDPKFIFKATILVDYKVRTADGSPTFLMVKGGFSDNVINEMKEQLYSGATIADLAKDFSCADLAVNGGSLLCTNTVMDPVGMVDGNYNFTYKDMVLAGGIPLTFLRAYNSIYEKGALGKGFTHSYEYYITDDAGILRVTMPGGEETRFLRLKGGGYKSLQNSGFSLSDISGGYVMEHENGSRFIFSSDGTLSEIINPAGVTIATLTYNTSKQLINISGKTGEFNLAWEGNHITEVLDSAGRKTLYEYDNNLLKKVTNPDGDSIAYEYDGNGFLSKGIDFEGNEYVRNVYDAKGRVLSQVFKEGDGEKIGTFSYDDENRVNTFIDGNGRAVKYYYDKHRNLTKIEDDEEREEETGFDKHKPVSSKNKNGGVTRHILDANNRVQKIIYPDNSEVLYTYAFGNKISRITYYDGYEEFSYDSRGNIISYRDKNGNVTNYTYNTDGLLLTETDPMGGIRKYLYDHTRMVSMEDEEGGKTTFEYDSAGRVIKKHVVINNTEEAVTSYEYSPAGKLIRIVDAQGGETKYEYNKNGFMTKVVNREGETEEASYGGNGKIIYHKDAMGGETGYSYGKRDGELTKITDPEGNETNFSYNKAGKVKSKTDPEGNITTYDYDKEGNVTKIKNALSEEKSYTYDAMGRIKTETDENGAVTYYEYDKAGRLIKETNPMGEVTLYKYDPAGNLIEKQDANGVKTGISYDKCKRAVSVTDGEGNTSYVSYDKTGRVSGKKDALSNEISYEYDAAGNLVREADENGNQTNYEYDKLGNEIKTVNPDGSIIKKEYDKESRLVSYTDEENNKTEFSYDKNGNNISEKDALGNIKRHTYDKNNRLTATANPDGGIKSYQYDGNGKIKRFTDERGYVSEFTYDSLKRLKSLKDPEGTVNEYRYDSVGNMLKSIRKGVVREENEYDNVGRLISKTDSLGNREEYFYDREGNLLRHKDKEGNFTKFLYNNNYQITETEDALGNKNYNYYDKVGRRVRTVDENGNYDEYVYDKKGNILEVKDALSGTEKSFYDSMDRLKRKEDKLGNITSYIYDKTGKLIEKEDAIGNKSSYTYDGNGNLKLYINRNNEKTYYAYDSMNRMLKMTNRLNHSREYSYDLSGNIVSLRDGNKNVTEYSYDGLGRLLKRISPEGSTKEYCYDYMGNIEKLIFSGAYGKDAVREYRHDAEGNLIETISPSGSKAKFTYDKKGNLLVSEDPRGEIVEYTYDKVYNNTRIKTREEENIYTYDKTGNILTAKGKEGSVSFTYDKLYRIIKTVNENNKEILYSYDKEGNLLKTVYTDGKEVKRSYDPLGNLTGIKDADDKIILYTRDGEGNLIKKEYPDGSTTEYDYNGAGLLVQQKEVDHKGITKRQTLLGYDDNGNIKLKHREGVFGKEETVKYIYDKDNRLVKLIKTGTMITTGIRQGTESPLIREYTYDRAGNILSDGENTYEYDIENHLIGKKGKRGNKIYRYDRAGNLTEELSVEDGKEKSNVKYTYDSLGRLVKGENARGEESKYTYNALGVRIRNVQLRENKNKGHQSGNLKEGSRGEDYLDYLKDGRETKQRVYTSEVGTIHQNNFEEVIKDFYIDYITDENRDIEVAEKGSFRKTYIYDDEGKRTEGSFDYAERTKPGEAGENPASYIAKTSIQKVFYKNDLLSSSEYATDEKGRVLSVSEYDEWGLPLTETYTDMNFSGIDNINNYTGYTYDEVLKQYYAQNRFYDPENRRFTQEDDVEDGDNWYNYCNNNPVNYVDPSGNMYYTTQTDDLIKGIGKNLKGQAKSLLNIAETLDLVSNLAHAIFHGDISVPELAKILGKGIIEPYQYLCKHISVLKPFSYNTDGEVTAYGERMGTLLTDITLALAGASAAKVAKYLSKTGRGSRILNVLNKYKKPAVKLENKAPLPGKTGAYHTTLICKTFNETSNLNKLAIKNISHYKGFNYNVWGKEPKLRGSLIDKIYNNLGQNFPVFDRIEGKTVISLKSIDLKAKTYQNKNVLAGKLKGYVDDIYTAELKHRKVENYRDRIHYNSKQLLLAVPNKELTGMNIEVLNSIKSYAGGKNISIRIVVIH